MFTPITTCRRTQRSKKLIESNCEAKTAGELTTKRRQAPFRKRRHDAFVICRGQTRSLKLYSFLNGVMALERPPPMDGSSGPETKVHRGTATKRVSTALYGLYVCHFAVYSDCVPVSLRKENDLCSPVVHRTAGLLLRSVRVF